MCPVEISMSLLSSKWKIFIIRDLLTGKKRFSELKKSLGCVTQKMLTQSLRSLEDDGLVTRTVYPVVPPKVEYELTDLGQKLEPIIEQMKAFGAYYKNLA